ncbi:envelope glycoprotein K [Gallid alphaherpesvirus 1]|uniref:Envelope glycoprotein K n=1 Tax=Infectious laryngotracheitis virus TaxID=10386 RepID=Q69296_ILTV|nr:envelope glycoprotein K [Gallid alphaherpesvirus 1]AAB48439.1 glycoprotein K [Gallid alphaherpesvirus 1]
MLRPECLKWAVILTGTIHIVFLVWYVCSKISTDSKDDCLYVLANIKWLLPGQQEFNPVHQPPATFNSSLVYVLTKYTQRLNNYENHQTRCVKGAYFENETVLISRLIPLAKEQYSSWKWQTVSLHMVFPDQSCISTVIVHMLLADPCQRRMFGSVCRENALRLDAYHLNYWTAFTSRLILRVPYTKMQRFLREFEHVRDCKSLNYVADPLGFCICNPGVLVLKTLEIGLYLASLIMSTMTLRICYDPCAYILHEHVKISAWVYVIVSAVLELLSLMGYTTPAKTKVSASKPPSILTSCLANIASSLVLRALCVAAIASIVIIAFKYEQKIQNKLFGP